MEEHPNPNSGGEKQVPELHTEYEIIFYKFRNEDTYTYVKNKKT